ncbi:---NA--- [Paramuricea clavata]|uniref:---NA n=1 Tax=Paramuricea clavata TaxID=317549 RepID=A0A6S7JNS8_PARCT|nr:---NA--- [Paramuricea clavata]
MILVFKTAVSWMKIPRKEVEKKVRFPGQWLLFNCSVNTSEEVTLSFKKNSASEEKRLVIDKKIILVSKNIFNITSLAYMDMGYYMCRVRRLEKQVFLEILEGNLILKIKLILYRTSLFLVRHYISTCEIHAKSMI